MDNIPSRLGNIPRTYSTRLEHSFISPLIEEKDYVPYRVSTSQVSERDENNHHVEKVFKNKENIVKDEFFIMNRPKIDFSPGSEARQKVKTEFNLPRWEPFRKWFFPNFDEN
ncbi:hypothetical protein M9H77_06187 [Catharanthus roseus]|uniref:Uncharacterized protein n=1 Tax=Catharanthus roseus TaxID=4058 RepID=A0ACC0BRQ0_CATRO|nr:hypothetical protein M9H77_06187 [Catharanthus roseus]